MDTNDLLDLRNSLSQHIKSLPETDILNEGIMVDGSLMADIHAQVNGQQVLITIKHMENNYEEQH